MITETILYFLFGFPLELLNSLPDIKFEIPDVAFQEFYDIISSLTWALPVVALMPILVISFALQGFKIAWALILRIKSFIPTMGD